MNGFREKIKEESARIRREARERTIAYVTTALGIVAGLAWNEAIKGLIDYFFPAPQNSLLAKFSYAVSVTVLIVIFTIYLVRFLGKKDEE